jgi:hypothetical protein
MLAESRNISSEGIFVASPVSLSIGSTVQMTFSVPGQDVFHKDVHYQCEGTVVRLEPMGSGFGIAVLATAITVEPQFECPLWRELAYPHRGDT